jgi:hypothetical protein
MIPLVGEMERWIEQLAAIGTAGKYEYRMPGTPAGHRGAEFILAKFNEFGLSEAFVEQTDTLLCLPEAWRLSLHTVAGDEQLDCGFIRYAGFTPEGGIRAPIRYVGQGSEQEFDACDVDGRIALVDLVASRSAPIPERLFTHDVSNTLKATGTMEDFAENWPIDNLARSYSLASDRGAAGYVGILTFTVADNPQYHHWYADGSLPGLTISPRAGARLRDQLARGDFEASMVLTGQERTGPISDVSATLAGRTTETIVVHTHHDGWAVNEASGCAVVLALAKHFAECPKESLRRTLRFVAFDSHFGKRRAKPSYWEKMLPNVVAAVSIEMIARHFRIEAGEYVDTGLVSPTVFGVSQANPDLLGIVRKAIVEHNLDRSAVVGRFFGDGNEYSKRGIPLIERIAHNAPQFTSDDTLDRVMVPVLRPTVSAFVDIIRSLDSMSADTLAGIVPNPE